MKTSKILASLLIMATVLFVSCRKDPLTPPNETELITTLKLTFTDTAAPYTSYTAVFRDIDGDGGIDATLDSLRIPAGKVYAASLLLLDERDASAVDTTNNEIEEESAAHQFFYQSIPSDVITNFTYLTFDDNGKPLGTEFGCNTKSAPATGTLRITLRHQPDKDAAGVSGGDISNANGETDIEVEFPVRLY